MAGHGDLVMIRQFFDDATRARPLTAFARVKCILTLDLCLEHALNIVVRDFGTPEQANRLGGRRDLAFSQLWELANEVAIGRGLIGGLPNGSDHKTLHEARNLTQHRGVVPSLEQVERSVEPARQTLAAVCDGLYGANFDSIQMWDGLECDALREWLHDCDSVSDDHPLLAIVGCKLGYELIVECVRQAASHPHMRFRAEAAMFSMPAEARKVAEGLQKAFEAMETEIVAVGLGLPIANHHQFLRCGLGVNVYRTQDGVAHCTLGVPFDRAAVDSNVSDARFMVHYLARAAVLLESAYPGVFSGFSPPRRLQDEPLWSKMCGDLAH